MSVKIEFEHRRPPADWKSDNRSIMGCLRDSHVAPAAMVAQELLDTITNLSIARPPTCEEVDEMIYKARLIRDNLLDSVELLNDLDRD